MYIYTHLGGHVFSCTASQEHILTQSLFVCVCIPAFVCVCVCVRLTRRVWGSWQTPQERNQDATLYVGNLEPEVDEAILAELFIQCGPISCVPAPSPIILFNTLFTAVHVFCVRFYVCVCVYVCLYVYIILCVSMRHKYEIFMCVSVFM